MKRLGLAVALLAPPVVEPAHPQPSAAETAIIRGASASEVLQAWCADHGLPKLVAERTPLNRPADLVVRGALAARPGQAVRHRHVQLVCGGHTLSEADNWYLPDRLTRTMNETLDATDTP